MSSPQYLRVRNWEKFQHYKDRRPIWIKYHVELLDDYELTTLDYVTQLLYDRMLLLAARTDNNVPNDSAYVCRMTSIEETEVSEGIAKLLDKGFLVLSERKRSASKVIARLYTSAIPEKRREEKRREEKEQDPKTIARMEQIQEVVSKWSQLSPPLIAHRETYFQAAKTNTAIEAALRLYPVDAVVEAVENYATVLGGSEYRWDHSWTLIDFLKRGLDKFVPEAEPLTNFRVRENGKGRVSNLELIQRSSERWKETHPQP